MTVPVTAQSFGIATGLPTVTGTLSVPTTQRQQVYERPHHDILMQYGLTSEEAKPISDANIGPDFIYELVYMLATTPKAKVLEYVYNKDTKHANIVFEGPMMAQTVSSARREEELLREGEKPEPEGIYECPYCGSSKDTVSSTNFVRRGDEPPIITGYCVSCKKSFKISG